MAWSIVGYRRADDGLPGSWTPDVPKGIPFSSICGDTTNTVARLRAGTDAESTTADPGRLAIVRTATAFQSPSRIPLGRSIDSKLTAGGRFLIESAIGRELAPGVTVRRAIRALLNSWDDGDDDKPNAIKPDRDGVRRARLGDDVFDDDAPARGDDESLAGTGSHAEIVDIREMADGGVYVLAEYYRTPTALRPYAVEDFLFTKPPTPERVTDTVGRVRIGGVWVWPTNIVDGNHVPRPDLADADKVPGSVKRKIRQVVTGHRPAPGRRKMQRRPPALTTPTNPDIADAQTEIRVRR